MKHVGASFWFGWCGVIAAGCSLPRITSDYVESADVGGTAGRHTVGGASSNGGVAGGTASATAGRGNGVGGTNGGGAGTLALGF